MRTVADYRVAIVVARDFGPRLQALASRCHVWAVRSPGNEAATEAIRATEPVYSPESGVTLFNADASPDAELLSIIGVVEEHHGEHSHDPAVSAIEVIGARPTPAVRDQFAAFGFDRIEATPDGFIALRDNG